MLATVRLLAQTDSIGERGPAGLLGDGRGGVERRHLRLLCGWT